MTSNKKYTDLLYYKGILKRNLVYLNQTNKTDFDFNISILVSINI